MADQGNSSVEVVTGSSLVDTVEEAPLAVTIVYLILLTFITLAGNVGNAIVIGAVLTDRRLRKEGNIFIINLAIADLCVTSIVDPFSMVGVLVGHEFFWAQSELCDFVATACLVSCVCSLWSIGGISVNRYILLCRQSIYPRIFTVPKTIAYCLAIWLFAFMLDLPNYVGWGDHKFDMKKMTCSYNRTANYPYTFFFIMMFVSVPLVTVLFCNVNIYLVVLRSRRRVAAHRRAMNEPNEMSMTTQDISQVPVTKTVASAVPTTMTVPTTIPTTNDTDTKKTNPQNRASTNQTKNGKLQTGTGSQWRKELKLAKTLFIVFIAFCLCWTPYSLLCLIDRYDRAPVTAYAVAVLMAHASSTTNSILYAATNKAFRDGYKLFLSNLRRKLRGGC